jgi:hypothetical protein
MWGPKLAPASSGSCWVELGLDLIARAALYKSHRPAAGEHEKSAFFSFGELRRVAASNKPDTEPWWWIYAPFVRQLLDRGSESFAAWLSIGRITSKTDQEWLSFYADDLADDRLTRFITVASVNAAHPKIAQESIYLSTALLHDLAANTDGSAPPVALLMTFGSKAPHTVHESIIPISFTPLNDGCSFYTKLCNASVTSGAAIPPAHLDSSVVTKYLNAISAAPGQAPTCKVSWVASHIGTQEGRLKAFSAWVQDLAQPMPWDRILTISASPPQSTLGLHGAAIIIYLRRGKDVGDLHSSVLGFRAGALATYEVKSVLSVDEFIQQLPSFDALHDDSGVENGARLLAAFLGVAVESAKQWFRKTTAKGPDPPSLACLKALRDAPPKLTILGASFVLMNAAALHGFDVEPLVAPVLSSTLSDSTFSENARYCSCVPNSSEISSFCRTLYQMWHKLVWNDRDLEVVLDKMEMKNNGRLLVFTCSFSCLKGDERRESSLLESLRCLVTGQQNEAGGTARAVHALWTAYPQRSSFQFASSVATLHLNSGGLILRCEAVSDDGSTQMSFGYEESSSK